MEKKAKKTNRETLSLLCPWAAIIFSCSVLSSYSDHIVILSLQWSMCILLALSSLAVFRATQGNYKSKWQNGDHCHVTGSSEMKWPMKKCLHGCYSVSVCVCVYALIYACTAECVHLFCCTSVYDICPTQCILFPCDSLVEAVRKTCLPPFLISITVFILTRDSNWIPIAVTSAFSKLIKYI